MTTKKRSKAALPPVLTGEAATLHARLLTEFEFADGASLTTLHELCSTLQRLRDVQAAISADGLVISGSTGQPRAHPLLAVEDALRRTLLAHARALRINLPEG